MDTTIHDFIILLNETLDAQFPDTERFIIKGGDHAKDFVIELRQNGCTYRYSPYKLFQQSKNYEETIEMFLDQWGKILADQ